MAKKKINQSEVEAARSMDALTSFIDKNMGDDAPIATDIKPVIPVPLPLQWLLDSNGMWLGGIYGLAGFEESQKTGLAHELLRLMHKGVPTTQGAMADAEGGKYNPLYIQSILGDDYRQWYKAYMHLSTVEASQALCTNAVRWRHQVNLKYGPEPFVIILDSLAGQAAGEDVDKMLASGAAERGFAIEANLWNKYFKMFNSQLVKSGPTMFIFVNHMKDKPASRAGLPPGVHQPGGRAPKFHSSFMFQTRVIKKDERQEMVVDGERKSLHHHLRIIRVSSVKTSLGTGERSIDLPFIWHRETEDGSQRSWFDWDATTAHLLARLQNSDYKEGSGANRAAIKAVLSISMPTTNTYTCKRLGVDGVTAAELGKLINSDPELLEEVFTALRIQRFPVWGKDPASYELAKPDPAGPVSDEPKVARVLKREEDDFS